MKLAIFDLDYTLIPIDSDFEWGQFLVRLGVVDPVSFAARNQEFFEQYLAGTLDPVAYLHFAFGTLAAFPRAQLDQWHQQFMAEVITPAIRPAAMALVEKHQAEGDLTVIISATNSFITGPIAREFKVEHLIAAEPEVDSRGEITGQIRGTPTHGQGKVSHLHAWLASRGTRLDQFERSAFYSDSHNDLPLLSAVTDPVATNPNEKLKAHALAHGWPVLNLFND
ncbi:histidinol-phosphatase [Lacisediminimonas profundi]|uniref:histidinol-phosphatase n=1 Tax=Lacisediminimonas profundi TaxID=2603856 RepID=UPI00124B9552|nr:HAD family hydrolase [Lacisediminimonas profundi]